MAIFPARIARIWQATPSIRAFELEADDPGFKYLPGQWLEVSAVIEGETLSGGYSITTSPAQAGAIGLAIRRSSSHRLTRWLHDAQAGDTLSITRGQGPFVFLPDMGEDIVLIGGGVGVTPLLSIFRFVRDASPTTHATLCYSASCPEEILFREELEQSARQCSHLDLEITITRPGAGWQGQSGRINKRKLAALNAPPGTLFYLCGPPGMVEDLSAFLSELGVPQSRIIFEKWW